MSLFESLSLQSVLSCFPAFYLCEARCKAQDALRCKLREELKRTKICSYQLYMYYLEKSIMKWKKYIKTKSLSCKQTWNTSVTFFYFPAQCTLKCSVELCKMFICLPKYVYPLLWKDTCNVVSYMDLAEVHFLRLNYASWLSGHS